MEGWARMEKQRFSFLARWNLRRSQSIPVASKGLVSVAWGWDNREIQTTGPPVARTAFLALYASITLAARPENISSKPEGWQ